MTCLLCRGAVLYKAGDATRFRAHLANEHGAVFDWDYLLASSLMGAGERQAILHTVVGGNFEQEYNMNQQAGTQNGLEDISAETTNNGINAMDAEAIDKPYVEEKAPKKEEKIKKEKKRPEDVSEKDFGVNIHKSLYLSSNTHCKIRLVRDGVISQYSEVAEGLPEGWKYKEFDVKQGGIVSRGRNYLAPGTNVVLLSAMGVLEYLRLQGASLDQIRTIAPHLKVMKKKLARLMEMAERSEGFEVKKEIPEEKEEEVPPFLEATLEQEMLNLQREIQQAEPLNTTANATEEDSVVHADALEDSAVTENEMETIAKEKEESKKNRKKENSNGPIESFSADGSVDLRRSTYFTSSSKFKFKQISAVKIGQYTEVADGLPDGWKCRTVDVKNGGKTSQQRHFLCPAGNIVLLTAMGVLEYLRLEGLPMDQIYSIAPHLRVMKKKLVKLFGNDGVQTKKGVEVVTAKDDTDLVRKMEDISTTPGSLVEHEAETEDEDELLQPELQGLSEITADNSLMGHQSETSFEAVNKWLEAENEMETIAKEKEEPKKNRKKENSNGPIESFSADNSYQSETSFEAVNKWLEDSTDTSLDETTADSLDVEMAENTLEERENEMEQEDVTEEDENDAMARKKMKKEKNRSRTSDIDFGVDINRSLYLSTNSLSKIKPVSDDKKTRYTEVAEGLPEGWRYREFDSKQGGKITKHRHYLCPAGNAVLLSTMGVLEYLRLEGGSDAEIRSAAHHLKIRSKKLARLASTKVKQELSTES